MLPCAAGSELQEPAAVELVERGRISRLKNNLVLTEMNKLGADRSVNV